MDARGRECRGGPGRERGQPDRRDGERTATRSPAPGRHDAVTGVEVARTRPVRLSACTMNVLSGLVTSIRVSKPRLARSPPGPATRRSGRRGPASGRRSWLRSSSRRPRPASGSRGSPRRRGGCAAWRSTGTVLPVAAVVGGQAGVEHQLPPGENSEKHGVEPKPTNTPRRADAARCPRCRPACRCPAGGTGAPRGRVVAPVEPQDQPARGGCVHRGAGLVVEQADLVRAPPSARRAGSGSGRRGRSGSCSPCRPASR